MSQSFRLAGMARIPQRDLADNLVPIEDIPTRQLLWEEVWDWIIRECERRALEQEATARPQTSRSA